MHPIGFGLLVLAWLGTTACSSSDASSNDDIGSGGRAGAQDGASGAAGSDASGGTAGSPTAAGGLEETWVEADYIESCDDVCAAEGNECGAVCGDDNTTAADTLYTYYSESGMNFNQQRQFDFCDTPVDSLLEYNGDQYQLVTLRCCCLALPVERLDGDPADPVSCDELCATEDMVCFAETYWEGLATSGLMATYQTIDGWRYVPGDCDEVPPLTVNRIGNDEPLTAYRCGCVAP